MKVSSKLVQDVGASVRDVAYSIGDAGSTRPGLMPPQAQVSTRITEIEKAKYAPLSSAGSRGNTHLRDLEAVIGNHCGEHLEDG